MRRGNMATPAKRTLVVNGVDGPLALTVSPRARRLSLRLDAGSGEVRVVVPRAVPEAEVTRFVARHAEWLRRRLAALPPARPFHDGAVLPYLGEDHRIRHDPAHRRPVERRDGVFLVGGQPAHLPRRLTDFLRREARRELTGRAHRLAAAIDRRVAGITVRDTRSRWGSCSAAGRLNFSWRLLLAPEPVLDYVVAHEVAHLAEMNHGARFWALVNRLHTDVPAARAWLKVHGAGLHRHG
ncbi:MAG: M48 family metallopeptidase [Inquilinus sp.]|nr:M48 family metallopeptidase [Inquilinus sp.]